MLLEELFRGNLSAVDLVYPADPEYRQLNEEALELSVQLQHELSPAHKELLDQLTNTIYSAQLIESEAYFTFGVSIGVQLQREIQEQLSCFTE